MIDEADNLMKFQSTLPMKGATRLDAQSTMQAGGFNPRSQ